MRNKKPLVILGFPGVGKTAFAKKRHKCVLDLDSSSFSKNLDGTTNGNFPENYVGTIKSLLKGDGREELEYILVSSHKSVRQKLNYEGIPHTIVYPYIHCKAEYLQRYRDRKSSEQFIQLMDANWLQWIMELEQEGKSSLFSVHIRLNSGFYLSDCY